MRRAALLLLASGLLLGGCTFQSSFNPAYVSFEPTPATAKLAGAALVVTDPANDTHLYVGKPTSFTGGGTTLTMPLGQVVKEIALKVFGDLFAGGALHAKDAAEATAGQVVILPRLDSFAYEYNQLKNVGFAITPGVRLSLALNAQADGREVLQKLYVTPEYFAGDAYMISGQPGEAISKTAHQALVHLMRQASGDLRGALASAGPRNTPAGTVRLEDLPLPKPAPQ